MGKIEKNEYPERVYAFKWNNETVLSREKPAGESIEYRKVGEEEDEFRKYLDGITTDNICNEYVHGFNDAIQVIKDRFETYELHRKEGK